MRSQALQEKRQFIAGKFVIGIDPGRDRHQACVLNPQGVERRNFTFTVNRQGFDEIMLKTLSLYLNLQDKASFVFAIETACNLWQCLAHFLSARGYSVVLVNPLTTYHSRALPAHDYSKTDPKDALLVASNARHGYFDWYRTYSAEINAMHQLSMVYCKIRNTLLQQRSRLRTYINYVFPEFFEVVRLDTHTARFLLKRYFLPKHYLELELEKVAAEIAKISGNQYNLATLKHLREKAVTSIGIPKSALEESVDRIAVETWLAAEEQLQKQLDCVLEKLLVLAKKTAYFNSIVSIKGVSDILASLFIAETRDLALFQHYKQIEKLAGYNLRLVDSGRYAGARRISGIGNSRLSWVLYKMTEEMSRYVPEVRVKYLTRQIAKRCYRKNLVACVPKTLQLTFGLAQLKAAYQPNAEALNKVKKLEQQYEKVLKGKKRK
jgi:transposase